MPYLRELSKEEDHDHLVYVRDIIEEPDAQGQGIVGFTSKDAKHRHEIRYIPEQPEQIDQASGAVTAPRVPAHIKVMPAGKNNHVHEIGEIVTIPNEKRVKKTTDESKELSRLVEYISVFTQATEDDRFYREQANTSEGMYFGDGQWADSEREKLNEDERPALQINKIDPKIKVLIGYEFQNGVVPKTLPSEDGDQEVADIFNGLNYHFFDKNDYPHVRNEVFEDICVTGRGSYLVRLDHTKNLEGDIVIERAPWQDVNYLEHDMKSIKDCEGASFGRWISEGQLKLIAPKDKLKEIENISVFDLNQTIVFGDRVIDLHKTGLINQNTKKVRLVKAEKKEYKKRTAIAHPDDDYYLDGMEGRVPSWLLDKSVVDRIMTIPGFIKIDRMVQEIWIGVFAGGILLSDTLSPFSGFTLMPGYATKRKHKIKGKVYDLWDPQREINKRRSTMGDLASRISIPKPIYDSNTFEDEEAEQVFLDEYAIPGAPIKVADKRNNVVDILPAPQLPRDLILLEQQSTSDLTEISGINEELVGIGSNAQSTPLFLERRNAALISNEFLFAGLGFADKALALRMLEAYRLILTPERVFRILENSNRKMRGEGGLKIGGLGFEKYSEEQIKQIWERIDISRYDVSIGKGEDSPTKRAADFKVWSELGKQGLQNVSAEFLLELADVPPDQREKLTKTAQQQQQQQLAIQQKQLSIEENKTQLAADSREKIELEKIASNERIELAKLTLETEKLKVSTIQKQQEIDALNSKAD